MKPLAKPVEELGRKQLPHHEDPRCVPVRRLLQTVGSKWCSLVVAHLEYEPRRFSDLKRSIGGVTQKSLTATLRELEKDGLVNRVVTPSIPPRVDYSLTPLGRTLLAPLKALTDWAIENEAAVSSARERFEQENGAD
ncbi:winged helix-turn-helix transcriptional regulator [Roseibium sp. LAB1]